MFLTFLKSIYYTYIFFNFKFLSEVLKITCVKNSYLYSNEATNFIQNFINLLIVNTNHIKC